MPLPRAHTAISISSVPMEANLGCWSRDWDKWFCHAGLPMDGGSTLAVGTRAGRISTEFRYPGGDPEQVTRSRANTVQASADGKWIYYSTESVAEAGRLWRLPAAGGEPVEVIRKVAGRNYVALENGIRYLTPFTRDGSLLQFYDFATRTSRTVYRLPRKPFLGLRLPLSRAPADPVYADRPGHQQRLGAGRELPRPVGQLQTTRFPRRWGQGTEYGRIVVYLDAGPKRVSAKSLGLSQISAGLNRSPDCSDST